MTDDYSEQLEPIVEDTPAGPSGPGNTPAIDAPEPTGNPAVDRVLESLVVLADAPVEEHVAVFEAAHDQLRGALAGAGNPADAGAHPQR